MPLGIAIVGGQGQQKARETSWAGGTLRQRGSANAAAVCARIQTLNLTQVLRVPGWLEAAYLHNAPLALQGVCDAAQRVGGGQRELGDGDVLVHVAVINLWL